MHMKTPETTLKTFEEALARVGHQSYSLQLYIAGSTQKSMRAIANTRQFCAKFLAGRYELDIIDIYQTPALAKEAQIIAVPTLVRSAPLPVKRIIGEMSDIERIVSAIDQPQIVATRGQK